MITGFRRWWLQVSLLLPLQCVGFPRHRPPPRSVQTPSSAHLFKVSKAAFDRLPLSSPDLPP